MCVCVCVCVCVCMVHRRDQHGVKAGLPARVLLGLPQPAPAGKGTFKQRHIFEFVLYYSDFLSQPPLEKVPHTRVRVVQENSNICRYLKKKKGII